jgi:hypothetical protein
MYILRNIVQKVGSIVMLTHKVRFIVFLWFRSIDLLARKLDLLIFLLIYLWFRSKFQIYCLPIDFCFEFYLRFTMILLI